MICDECKILTINSLKVLHLISYIFLRNAELIKAYFKTPFYLFHVP